MDNSAALRSRALFVARAIHDLAATKGWGPGSYLIFATGNPSWNLIRLGVASDHFTKDEYEEVSDESYLEVIKHLQSRLAEIPGLFESLSINLFTFDDSSGLAALYYPILDDDEVEVDFAALNPGIADPRSPMARGSAQGGN